MTEKQSRKKTINRVEKDRNFSVIHNHGPHDHELTWGARGLLTYMLTKPDDFSFYNEELAKHSPEGVSVVKRLIKELKQHGYIKRSPLKDPITHKIIEWETILFEIPREPDSPKLIDSEDESEDEKPEVENGHSGSNLENTPEVEKPEGGKASRLESHAMENRPLLNTDSLLNTDKQKDLIPVGEQKPAPGVKVETLPDKQKPTAILFLTTGGKPELSQDDATCLNLLFKIHTPAAVQAEILKAFERLMKNGSVKVAHPTEEGKEYTITKREKLPIRYIYNSMKNWTSLKNAGKGGAHGASRSNNERAAKNYEGKNSGLFV